MTVYLLYSMAVEAHSGPASAVMKNQIGVYVNFVIIILFVSNIFYLAITNLWDSILKIKKWNNLRVEKNRLKQL